MARALVFAALLTVAAAGAPPRRLEKAQLAASMEVDEIENYIHKPKVVAATEPHFELVTHQHAHISVSGAEAAGLGLGMSGVFATAQAQGLAAFNLGRLGAQCKCSFHGVCGCDGALEFMDCIASSCHTGACNCEGNLQFLYACHNMSAVCPSTSLMCTADTASCFTSSADAPGRPAAELKPSKAPTATEAPAPTTTQALPEPKTEEEKASAKTVGDGAFRDQESPQIEAPQAPKNPFADMELPDGPDREDIAPSISQRKCFYLIMVLIIFCSAFGLAAHSEHGLKVGSAVAAVAPFFVLMYLLATTDIMHRFWMGQKVGWWCALLCMWCAIQILIGIGVLAAVCAQGKSKPRAAEEP